MWNMKKGVQSTNTHNYKHVPTYKSKTLNVKYDGIPFRARLVYMKLLIKLQGMGCHLLVDNISSRVYIWPYQYAEKSLPGNWCKFHQEKMPMMICLRQIFFNESYGKWTANLYNLFLFVFEAKCHKYVNHPYLNILCFVFVVVYMIYEKNWLYKAQCKR